MHKNLGGRRVMAAHIRRERFSSDPPCFVASSTTTPLRQSRILGRAAPFVDRGVHGFAAVRPPGLRLRIQARVPAMIMTSP